MVEQHSIPVLASNDYKISKDSANFIVDASQKMRSAARELVQRITNMDIIDIG